MEQKNYIKWRNSVSLKVKEHYPSYSADEVKKQVDDIEKRVKSYFPDFFWNFIS